MDLDNSMYCKIYIDTVCDHDWLIALVSRALQGRPHMDTVMVTEGMVSLVENEYFDRGATGE